MDPISINLQFMHGRSFGFNGIPFSASWIYRYYYDFHDIYKKIYWHFETISTDLCQHVNGEVLHLASALIENISLLKLHPYKALISKIIFNRAFPSQKYSIMAPAKWRNSF